MRVEFGNVDKEVNSTKICTIQGKKAFDVQIKENSNIINPTLIIRTDLMYLNANYCYIPNWHRYYWVHDKKIITGNRTEVYLRCDVLASHRASLLKNTAYVTRSANLGSKWYRDNVATHYNYTTTKLLNTISVFKDGGGTFILGVINNDSPSKGGVTYYALTGSQLSALGNYLMSDKFFKEVTKDIKDPQWSTFTKTMFNPAQYIVSCAYTPVKSVGGTSDKVKFGWWTSPASGLNISSSMGSQSIINASIPNIDGNWTDTASDWKQYYMYVPCIGVISIPSMYAGQSLKLHMYYDFATGRCTLHLYCGDTMILTQQGKCTADIPVNSISMKKTENIGGLISVGASIGQSVLLSGAESKTAQQFLNNDYGSFTDTANSVVDNAKSSLAEVQRGPGASGNLEELLNAKDVKIFATYYSISNNYNAKYGMPCYRIVTLGSCSGYTEVGNPDTNLSGATKSEIDLINNYLSGGFYVE